MFGLKLIFLLRSNVYFRRSICIHLFSQKNLDERKLNIAREYFLNSVKIIAEKQLIRDKINVYILHYNLVITYFEGPAN